MTTMTDEEKIEVANYFWSTAQYLQKNGWCRGILKEKDSTAVCTLIAMTNVRGTLEVFNRAYQHLRQHILATNPTPLSIAEWNDKMDAASVITVLESLATQLESEAEGQHHD